MKRSEFSKVVKLAKNSILEEQNWGEFELPAAKPLKKQTENKPLETLKPGISNSAVSNTELDKFNKEISDCKKCPLGETRLNFVFGDGNPNAKLMFVGEGPGFDEDHQGLPFVGKAGQLLTKIIEAIGFKRSDVYICNVVKCHPMVDPADREKRGNDRPPAPDEINACIGYLEKQIEIMKPELICVLGNVASKALLKTETGISKLRGNFHEYNGIKVMPTYHPAALLRTPSLKKDVWEDMKKIREELKTEK